MPIPAPNTAWPPADLAPQRQKWAEWDAWYANDTNALTTLYTATEQTRDGVLKQAAKAVVRYFWGEKRTDLTKPQERKLHVPVASDLCKASSDLLFNEPPKVTSTDKDKKNRDRLDMIAGPDFHSELARAAEIAAALGGSYLRVQWDKSVLERPFLTTVDYDQAVPVFAYGRLVEVTFWKVIHRKGQEVWRHVEHHYNHEGEAIIEHALFVGTDSNIGRRTALTDHPALADLPVNEESVIRTGVQGRMVVHWPNLLPNRIWRKQDTAKHFGRSDLDGIEPLLDGLDEAYTSLMRDIRLGKAMLVVPEGMLDNNGPGKGGDFAQNEIYSPVNAAPGSVADAKLAVEQVQFAIRVEEHERTILLLWNTLIRSAGYSAQTFGEGGEIAVTATEVFAKERRSGMTQLSKGRVVRPILEDVVETMRAVDNIVFGQSHKLDEPVNVVLADGARDDPKVLAETANMLAMALAASIETRVRLVNRDRDEEWITAEVDKIKAENQIALSDPDTVGVDGVGLSDAFDDTEGEDPANA